MNIHLLVIHCSFDTTKSTLDHYRGKDCILGFCKDLRKHEIKIVIYKKRNDAITN